MGALANAWRHTNRHVCARVFVCALVCVQMYGRARTRLAAYMCRVSNRVHCINRACANSSTPAGSYPAKSTLAWDSQHPPCQQLSRQPSSQAFAHLALLPALPRHPLLSSSSERYPAYPPTHRCPFPPFSYPPPYIHAGVAVPSEPRPSVLQFSSSRNLSVYQGLFVHPCHLIPSFATLPSAISQMSADSIHTLMHMHTHAQTECTCASAHDAKCECVG